MFDLPSGQVSQARLASVAQAACVAIATASIFASVAYAVGVHRVRFTPPHAHKAPVVAHHAPTRKP